MRNLQALSLAVIFLAFAPSLFAQTEGMWYMAFCTDGDGPLSEWLTSRADAVVAGRDHERANRGHHWEVFVQHGKVAVLTPACAAVAEDPARPDTIRVINTCDTCRLLRISRRYQNGTVKTKEFKVKPKSQRRFLKRAESEIVVETELECPKT